MEKSLTEVANHIKRDDVDIVEAFNILRREKERPYLMKMVSLTLMAKARKFLKDKTAREKLEVGKKVNSNFFWSIITKESDVEKLLTSAPLEIAISYPEEMGYNGLWDIVLKNPNIIRLLETA